MRRAPVTVSLLTLVAGIVLLAGCTHPHHPPRTTTTTSPPSEPGVMLRYEAPGGFCPPTGCGIDVIIRTDGSWVVTEGTNPPAVTTGRLDETTTADLQRRIDEGIDSVDALPPVIGSCVLPPDASEIIYTFASGDRTVVASNCRKVFGNNALIYYAGSIVGQVRSGIPPRLPLLEWTSRGGRCVTGMCFRSVTVDTSGAIVVQDGTTISHGNLNITTLTALTRRIEDEIITLATLESRTGPCPSAWDGQDVTYTFHVASGTVSVDNCTKVIPGGNALLLYVDDVLNLPNGPVPRESPGVVPAGEGVPAP